MEVLEKELVLMMLMIFHFYLSLLRFYLVILIYINNK
jgi:hypothetical protein